MTSQWQPEQELTRNDYALLHDRCAVCHWPASRRGRTLEIHHIVGGPGRKDIPENWLLICRRCHSCIHDKVQGEPDLPRGAVLAAKWEEDGFFDPAILAALKHRKALPYEPCPIPKKFLDERRKRGGKPWP